VAVTAAAVVEIAYLEAVVTNFSSCCRSVGTAAECYATHFVVSGEGLLEEEQGNLPELVLANSLVVVAAVAAAVVGLVVAWHCSLAFADSS